MDLHFRSHFHVFELKILVLIIIYPFHLTISQDSGIDTVEKWDESPDLQKMIIDLDFKNIDLKDLIRLIANQYKLNMFIADEVNVKITIHLVNITVAEALKLILKENQLTIEKTGSVYKITKESPPVPLVEKQTKSFVQFENERLSIDFQDVDVQEAFYQISQLTKKTILLDKNISGTISALIIDLPLQEALSSLAKSNGYSLTQSGSVYRLRRSYADNIDQNKTPINFYLAVHNNQIDLETNHVELEIILNELFRQNNANLFYLDELKGTVSVCAHDLTFDNCLHLLLGSHDYTFKKVNGNYLVGNKTNKLLLSSQLIPIKYVKVEGILDMLPEKIQEKAEFKIIKEHNAVLIHGSSDVIHEIEQILNNLDRPIPQILIEALVVDYNYQDIKEISIKGGLTGGKPDSTHRSGDDWFPGIDFYLTGKNVNQYIDKVEGYWGITNIGRLPDDFYLKVKALETVGKANIRSKPQIATLNGFPADITIGQTQYYLLTTQTPIRDPSQVYIQETQQFHTIEANITLKITPWVSASGEITVEIHPEFNNPVGQFSSEIPPTIQRRALNSTVRLRDGETIVLGGLIQTVDAVNRFQIPILGSLPLIGYLFRSTNHHQTKSELIIYITPHLSYSRW